MSRETHDREALDQVLHALRYYVTAVTLLQTGTQHLQTNEQRARLQRRLQVAHAAQASLDAELDRFLKDLSLILETQQNRLNRALQGKSSGSVAKGEDEEAAEKE